MVFKVKQRAKKKWSEHQISQAGAATSQPFLDDALRGQDQQTGYKVQYNWPYDFVSFVELAKIDVDVLFRNKDIDVDVPIDPVNRRPLTQRTRTNGPVVLEDRREEQPRSDSHIHTILGNGSTTTDDGHKHSYTIDINGNGRTSYDHGHMHAISNKVLARIYEDQERRDEETTQEEPLREEETTSNGGTTENGGSY
jgi:hypothetical protein